MGLMSNDTNSELSDGDDYPPGTEDVETQTKSEYPSEDRFRVDRRKLESMILAENGNAADKFFGKIMEETRTSISYPARLPTSGPRSKKDPHVRVSGIDEDDVKLAKDKILEVLDTTGSRVTLKIDVSYTDHSHIIGRGGRSIQKVMNETNCHIHFPDLNKVSSTEKSNQVSIAGELPDVEYARSKVRALMPVLVSLPYDTLSQQPNSQFIQYIEKECGVQVMVRPRSRGIQGSILIKGSEEDIPNLKNAVLRITQQFYRTLVPVTMSIEVTPIHHAALRGKNDANVRAIMGYTRAKISFPEIHDPKIPPLKKSSVVIAGDLESVLAARHLLLGSLPVIMSFDMRDDLVPNEETLDSMASVFAVCIIARTKQKQSTKTIIVKAAEKNIGSVYEIRRQLLNLWEEPIITAQVPPSYMLPPEVQKFLPLYSPVPGKAKSLCPRVIIQTPSPAMPNYFVFPALHSPLVAKAAHTPLPNRFPQSPYPTHVFPDPAESTVFDYTLHDYLYGPMPFSSTDIVVQQTVDRNTQTSSSSSGVSSPADGQSIVDAFDQAYINSVKKLEDIMNDMTVDGEHKSAAMTRQSRDRSPVVKAISTPLNRTSNIDWSEKRFEVGQALKKSPVLPETARTPTPTWSGMGFSLSSQSPLPSLGRDWGGLPGSIDQWGNEQGIYPPGLEPMTYKKPLGLTHSNITDGGNLPKGLLDDVSDVPTLFGGSIFRDTCVTFFSGITMATFLTLNENDLYSLGVSGQTQRTKLLLAIGELKQRRAPFRLNPAPGSQRRSPPDGVAR